MLAWTAASVLPLPSSLDIRSHECTSQLLGIPAPGRLPQSRAPHDVLPWMPSYERVSFAAADFPLPSSSCDLQCIVSTDLPGVTAGIGSSLIQLAHVHWVVELVGGAFELRGGASFRWADRRACEQAGAQQGLECMFAPLSDSLPGCRSALYDNRSSWIIRAVAEPWMTTTACPKRAKDGDQGVLNHLFSGVRTAASTFHTFRTAAQHRKRHLCVFDRWCPQPGEEVSKTLSTLRPLCPRAPLFRRGSFRQSLQRIVRPSAFFRRC